MVRWAHGRWRDESAAVMRTAYAGVPASPPQVPVLVTTGALDHTVPPPVQHAMARALRADYLCFAGVSHVGALLGRRAPLVAEMAASWAASRNNPGRCRAST